MQDTSTHQLNLSFLPVLIGKKFNFCFEKGYETKCLEVYLKSRSYAPHIQSSKVDSEVSRGTAFGAHWWVVERAHRWMNCFHRVLIRWGKKVENYESMQNFADGIIV